MKQYINVSGHNGLVRDPETGAILNTNSNARENAIKARNALINQQIERQSMQNRIEQLEDSVNNIENSLNEIKSLLLNLTK